MLNRLRIPEIGESIAEVDIVQWLKAEGDHVEKDEPLAALETAKVSLELPSPAAGTLARILVPAGATVRVGEVVAEIDDVPARAGAPSGAAGPGASVAGGGPQPSQETGDMASAGGPAESRSGVAAELAAPRGQAARLAERMPDLVARGGGASEPRREERVMPAAERALAEQRAVASQFQATGPGGRLLKEDVVRAGESAGRAGTEGTAAAGRKATTAAGSSRKAVASRREGAAGGGGDAPREAQPTATATLGDPSSGPTASTTGGPSSSVSEGATYKPVPVFEPASAPGPSAAESFAPSSSTGPASFAPPSTTSPGPESSAGGDIERRAEEIVRMSPIRRTIARQLLETQRNAALLTTFNEIDMGHVMSIRKEYQEAFQKRHGVKLGVMSFFVKAVVDALRLVPQLNAQIRGEDIVFRKYYDIGVAIGSGRGLVVPVLRDADRMGFARIERAIEDLSKRAGDGTLRLEELEGGTFTITNGGIFGSLLSTPIVNGPQSGILGMHAIQDRPVARGGQVAIRPMMYVALSYDHRIVDGREAVFFLRRIKEVLEMPARMLLEV